MDRLLRWWWIDPFTRDLHPSSQITVPDFVRRRIREVLAWPDDEVKASALREARDAFPHYHVPLPPPRNDTEFEALQKWVL